jgi:hypothetical protein
MHFAVQGKNIRSCPYFLDSPFLSLNKLGWYIYHGTIILPGMCLNQARLSLTFQFEAFHPVNIFIRYVLSLFFRRIGDSPAAVYQYGYPDAS